MEKESKATKFGNALKSTCDTLAILFIALRSAGVIEWNWYWLMMPIFVRWAVGVLSLAICGVAVGVISKKLKEE